MASPVVIFLVYFGRDPVGKGHAPVGFNADLIPGVAAVEGFVAAGGVTVGATFFATGLAAALALGAAFFTTGFLGATFFATGLAAALALGATFFTTGFLGAAFFATGLAAGFFTLVAIVNSFQGSRNTSSLDTTWIRSG